MGIGNLYDPINLESLHILNQCLRAHSLYKRDVNYLVTEDGKVLIIDEFTGRVLPGRRWSDGLHQAVEAKENVRIQEETRTMATITFQNLFRLYKKLSRHDRHGRHRGRRSSTRPTSSTSSSIPTNKPMVREDHQDVVYKTEREKFTAVIDEILECHERGQPVLVGTTSVEKSDGDRAAPQEEEDPARRPQRQAARARGVRRRAGGPQGRHHRLAPTWPAAAPTSSSAATPRCSRSSSSRSRAATPDAEPEAFAEVVDEVRGARARRRARRSRELGGLHILGTERHESRRIDNQLRGRAGRQGDPGSSRFYLSLEDDLMRIFAGDRVKSLMERMGMPDDEPIEHPWVTQVASRTRRSKVEGRNFDIRKNLLEYDDVMNEQRKTVYKIRQQLLLGIYTPEYMDDDGKPTGKMREIKPLPRIAERREAGHRRHGPPLRHAHAASRARRSAPKTVEEVEELYSMASLREDIYQFWGYRFDFKDGDGKKPQGGLRAPARGDPAEPHRAARAACSTSSTASSARSSRSAAPRTSRPRTGTGRGSRAASSSTSAASRRTSSTCTTPRSSRTRSTRRPQKQLDAKEKEMGTELLLRVFRHFYLEEIDQAWVEHLTNMEHLRDGIGLRGYGQRDPKQEYKKEGYDIFVTMMASTSSNVCTKLFKVQVQQGDRHRAHGARGRRAHAAQQRAMQMRHGGEVDRRATTRPAAPPALGAGRRSRGSASQPVRREGPKIGRNDPCPCGSGQKFKKCHGAALEDDARAAATTRRPRPHGLLLSSRP